MSPAMRFSMHLRMGLGGVSRPEGVDGGITLERPGEKLTPRKTAAELGAAGADVCEEGGSEGPEPVHGTNFVQLRDRDAQLGSECLDDWRFCFRADNAIGALSLYASDGMVCAWLVHTSTPDRLPQGKAPTPIIASCGNAREAPPMRAARRRDSRALCEAAGAALALHRHCTINTLVVLAHFCFSFQAA